jgi:glycosyltransferase involved in cell wall biosynthesis
MNIIKNLKDNFKKHNLDQSVLYISYDGMMEPLGQSQVLAYLKKLAIGRRIYLLSYEKSIDLLKKKEFEILKNEIKLSGIKWISLRYHRSPSVLATSWDIFCGFFVCLWLVFKYRLRIVHARSYVPSLMALVIKRVTGVKYIFDMRGFWPDEKVDGGSWRANGILYRITKNFERQFILESDHLVSLTKSGIRAIKYFDYIHDNMPPYTVISTCADLRHFSHSSISNFPKSNKSFVLGYIGSVGGYYMFDEVLSCFLMLINLRDDVRLLIINKDQHDYIKNRLVVFGVPDSMVELTSASHHEMPIHISRMDAGIFFYRPSFSRLATAPTRLAEFLGCGKPCLSNTGIGDMTEVLENEDVGVAIKSFDQESISDALNKILAMTANPKTYEKCVNTAQHYFSLDNGVEKYSNIYDSLSGI